jgi:hypothetical protein
MADTNHQVGSTYVLRVERSIKYQLYRVVRVQLKTLPAGAVFLHYSTGDILEEGMVMIQLVSSEQTIVRRVKVDINLSETVEEFRKLLRSPL